MDSCPNCQTRMRWNTRYQKYLQDTEEKGDVQWVAKMMKTDRIMLPCLNQDDEEKYMSNNSWYEDGSAVCDAVMGEI